MKNSSTGHGYIMIVTLIVVCLAVALVTVVANRGTAYLPFLQTLTDRQKAQELSLSGLQLAMSQLAYADVVSKEETEKSDEKKAQNGGQEPDKEAKTGDGAGSAQAKKMLTTLLPVLGRWQTFKFDMVKDGVDGQVKFCIMCEDGKINLNELYDFQEHKFVTKEAQSFLEGVCAPLGKDTPGEDAFKALADFLKARDDKVRDVTELVTLKAFGQFKNMLFYAPDEAQARRKDKKRVFT